MGGMPHITTTTIIAVAFVLLAIGAVIGVGLLIADMVMPLVQSATHGESLRDRFSERFARLRKRHDDEDDDDEDADDWAGFFAPFRSFAENTPFAGGFAGARGELPKSGAKLAQAAHQVLLSGDEAQMEKVTALLDETRRKIYGILAEESAEETPENTGE